MKNEKITLPGFTLVGLSTRTNNTDEMNPETSKIAGLMGNFLGNQLGNKIQHRATPGIIYSVYTEFESDEHGEYTYFVGEKVSSNEGQDLEIFNTINIPNSQYQKFTTEPGGMPDVVISAWQQIWSMKASDFGGKRRYLADFEVYDEKAADPSNARVDIYIGIEE